MTTKPSIVFAHGLWADGSCFTKLIVPLQAEGYECIAAQYGLNTTAEDVAVTKVTIGRVSSPVILVGHSYGGSVITGAGIDDRPDGVHLSYDRMASFLAPYQNTEALNVARELDAKVEALLASAAA